MAACARLAQAERRLETLHSWRVGWALSTGRRRPATRRSSLATRRPTATYLQIGFTAAQTVTLYLNGVLILGHRAELAPVRCLAGGEYVGGPCSGSQGVQRRG